MRPGATVQKIMDFIVWPVPAIRARQVEQTMGAYRIFIGRKSPPAHSATLNRKDTSVMKQRTSPRSATAKQTVKIAAAVVEQVKNKFKAFGTLIIRIGNIVVAHSFADKFSHTDYLGPGLERRSQRMQIAQIALVHTDYDIEVVEIGHSHLTATVYQLKSATAGMDTHSLVREVAHVPVARSRRIDLPSRCIAAGIGNGTHHTLGRRRTADISEANKQHPQTWSRAQFLYKPFCRCFHNGQSMDWGYSLQIYG